MRIIKIGLKLLCYLALAFVGSGVAALVFVAQMGGCPRLDEGAVQCHSPFYHAVGGYGLGVVYASLFTGLPALLALVGVFLLIGDLRRSWRRARAPGP